MSVAVYKGDEIFPDTMQYRIFIEAVFVEVVDCSSFRAVPPDRNVLVQLANIAEHSIRLGVSVLKIVELVCYFLREVTATLFITNEPKSGVPRSVSVEVVDPVFERGF